VLSAGSEHQNGNNSHSCEYWTTMMRFIKTARLEKGPVDMNSEVAGALAC